MGVDLLVGAWYIHTWNDDALARRDDGASSACFFRSQFVVTTCESAICILMIGLFRLKTRQYQGVVWRLVAVG
jgi:hypothetical protein